MVSAIDVSSVDSTKVSGAYLLTQGLIILVTLVLDGLSVNMVISDSSFLVNVRYTKFTFCISERVKCSLVDSLSPLVSVFSPLEVLLIRIMKHDNGF